MTEGKDEQQDAAASSLAPLGDASSELAHANPQPMSPEHRERFNEAEIKRVETRAELESDNRAMRERIALWVAYAIGAQVLVADLAFFIYGFGNDWHIPVEAIVAWLSAAVVQVLAVGHAITKSLFPPHAQSPP
jgi:hypothetical protein